MALSNKPQDDAKAMIDEYIHGNSIDSIALKYNHDAEDVEAIVVREPTDEPTPAPVQQPTTTVEDKKGK